MDEAAVATRFQVGHPATLSALVLFTLVSLALGVVANLVASRKAGFLRRYFLGNRSLGAFAVALTAAVMSGGTFLGFPSLVYTFGWIVGLWICSYMVAPLTILGILGKRIGQLSRRTGAITLPDLFRERFGGSLIGPLTSLVIIVFLTVFLVAQFKAGAGIMKYVFPDSWLEPFLSDRAPRSIDRARYSLGLAVFACTVAAYTVFGGFLAAIWTDVFQSVVMAIGVLILFPLAMRASGGLANATARGVEQAGIGFAFGPGAGRDFHPIGLAVSFFFMWAITGMGQPATLVRLMAFQDSRTLRYSIIYQAIYNALIYIPLIFIFVAARSILPGLETPDDAMPRLILTLANPYVAGLILAAPYGAVMSTVSGFLLIVASALVRDLYQRFVRPRAGEKELARAGHAATILVGVVAASFAIHPPAYLQLLIVFASAGMASAFLVPALFAAFWRRASAAGAVAAMAVGPIVVVSLYVVGYFRGLKGLDQGIGPKPTPPAFGAYYLLNLDPCVWGLFASLLAGVVVTLLTRPPDSARLAPLFDAPASTSTSP